MATHCAPDPLFQQREAKTSPVALHRECLLPSIGLRSRTILASREGWLQFSAIEDHGSFVLIEVEDDPQPRL